MKQYNTSQLGLCANWISDDALILIEKLIERGFRAYIAGGFIRDRILDTNPADVDITTTMDLESLKQMYPHGILCGDRVKKLIIKTSCIPLEITVLEKVDSQGSPLNAIYLDSRTRDFTVNALYYDHSSQLVYDFYNGLEHLKKNQLLSILPAAERIRMNPLTILRFIRLSKKFKWEVDPAEFQETIMHAGLLNSVSTDRIIIEFFKMSVSGSGAECFRSIRLAKINLFTTLRVAEPIDSGLALDSLENALLEIDAACNQAIMFSMPMMVACIFWFLLQRNQYIGNSDISNIYKHRCNRPSDADLVKLFGPMAQRIFSIWELQNYFPKCSAISAVKVKQHPSFNSALNLLQLRSKSNECDDTLVRFWTRNH